MSKSVPRTTICFESGLHKSLRIKAAERSCTVSELVNQAVRMSLSGEYQDFTDLENRKSEAQISFDEMVEQFKQDGVI